MTDKELRHLSRMELIQILLEQTRETERLQARVQELEQQLEDRRIRVGKVGSIAEASLQISGVMEAAQEAADRYVENVKQSYHDAAMRRAKKVQEELEQMKRDTKAKCEQMERDTKAKCEQMERDTGAKCEQMMREAQAGTYGGDGYDGQ